MAASAPVDLHRAMVETLDPKQYRLGTKVVAVREDALVLDGGEEIKAEGAIDARGAASLVDARTALRGAARARILLQGAAPGRPAGAGRRHRRRRPAVRLHAMPAARRGPADRRRRHDLGAQPARRGGAAPGSTPMSRRAAGSERRSDGEQGQVRPLPTGGDFAAFWRLGGARVAKLGLRGGFVHPVDRADDRRRRATALLLTRQRDFPARRCTICSRREAKRLWKKRELLRASPPRSPPPGRSGARLARPALRPAPATIPASSPTGSA